MPAKEPFLPRSLQRWLTLLASFGLPWSGVWAFFQSQVSARLGVPEEEVKWLSLLAGIAGVLLAGAVLFVRRLRHVGGLYRRRFDSVPFCPFCLESHDYAVHLFAEDLFGSKQKAWGCLRCDTIYFPRDGGLSFVPRDKPWRMKKKEPNQPAPDNDR